MDIWLAKKFLLVSVRRGTQTRFHPEVLLLSYIKSENVVVSLKVFSRRRVRWDGRQI